MQKALKVCTPFFILFLGLVFLVRGHSFFWDTIALASKQAHFYLENGFEKLLLPVEIDAGHPPFFGYYLGLVWSTLGRTLCVSHFAMLPFLLGIVWQVYRLVAFFIEEKYRWLAMLLVLTNTILLGQAALVSPDIALCFFFLLALNGIYYRTPWLLTIGTIGLGLVSLRGMILIGALFMIAAGEQCMEDDSGSSLMRRFKVFFPALLVTCAWYSFHHWHTGWWFSTPNEAWGGARQAVGLQGIVKNTLVLGWRLIDLGMIGWWLALGWLFYKDRRDGWVTSCNLPLAVPIILILFLAPVLVFSSNPIGHRYLLPVYITLTLAVIIWIHHHFETKKSIYLISFALLFVQLSGHFWVYPAKIAKGWDSSLAHLPYNQLRQKMFDYLQEKGINPSQVGSAFPNLGTPYSTDLAPQDKSKCANKNLKENEYVWYSNIFNDFSDWEIDELQQNWQELHRLESGQVYMVLYQNK